MCIKYTAEHIGVALFMIFTPNGSVGNPQQALRKDGHQKKNTAELKEVAAFSYPDVTVGSSTGVCKWTLLSSLESHSKQ